MISQNQSTNKQPRQTEKGNTAIDIRPEATDTWMRIFVAKTNSITPILNLVDELTGKENPFNGNTVRYYSTNSKPKNDLTHLKPKTLTQDEKVTIVNGIEKVFSIPAEKSPLVEHI